MIIGGTNIQVFAYNGGSVIFNAHASFSFSANTWYHVACVRNGSNINVYVNGVSVASTTSSSAIGNTSAAEVIGAIGTGYQNDFHGDIEELRISNVARWTSNFIPPTAPYGIALAQVTLQDIRSTGSKIMDGW